MLQDIGDEIVRTARHGFALRQKGKSEVTQFISSDKINQAHLLVVVEHYFLEQTQGEIDYLDSCILNE